MSYIDLFLDSKQPLVSPRFKCVEQDWRELEMIFPEQGFRSYFIGYLVSKLRKELKENGINSYQDRLDSPRLANISRFMSDIHFVGKAADTNVGRGVESTRSEAAERTGDSGDNEDATSGGNEVGKAKEKERGQETGPGPLRPIEVRDRLIAAYNHSIITKEKLPFDVPPGENAFEWLSRQTDVYTLHLYRRFMGVHSTLIESNKVNE